MLLSGVSLGIDENPTDMPFLSVVMPDLCAELHHRAAAVFDLS